MRNKVRWRLHPKQTLCYSGCVRDRCGHLLCFTTEAPLSRAAQGGTGDPRRGSRRICRLLHLAVSTVTAPHPQCFAHLRPWKTIPPLLFGSYCQIAFTNGPGHSSSFTLPWMFLYYQRLHAQYVFYFNNPWIFREWLRTGGGKTHIAHQVCFGNEVEIPLIPRALHQGLNFIAAIHFIHLRYLPFLPLTIVLSLRKRPLSNRGQMCHGIADIKHAFNLKYFRRKVYWVICICMVFAAPLVLNVFSLLFWGLFGYWW